MLEPLFFTLGFLNNGFLIFFFLIRKNHLALLRKIGWLYFFLQFQPSMLFSWSNRNKSHHDIRSF